MMFPNAFIGAGLCWLLIGLAFQFPAMQYCAAGLVALGSLAYTVLAIRLIIRR